MKSEIISMAATCMPPLPEGARLLMQQASTTLFDGADAIPELVAWRADCSYNQGGYCGCEISVLAHAPCIAGFCPHHYSRSGKPYQPECRALAQTLVGAARADMAPAPDDDDVEARGDLARAIDHDGPAVDTPANSEALPRESEGFYLLRECCVDIRGGIEHLARETKKLMRHPRLSEDHMVDQASEMRANLMLAYRHLEDARMRLGKVMEDNGERERSVTP